MSTESKNATGNGIIDYKLESRKVKCDVKGLEGINRGDQNDKIIQVLAYAYMYETE
jgi:hypothetical protein